MSSPKAHVPNHEEAEMLALLEKRKTLSDQLTPMHEFEMKMAALMVQTCIAPIFNAFKPGLTSPPKVIKYSRQLYTNVQIDIGERPG